MQRLNVFVVHLSAICFAFDKQDDSSNTHYRVLRQMELDTRLINTGKRCAFAFLLFVHFSFFLALSLSHSHTRARARALKLRERANRKDRTTIIDETNSYVLRRVGKFETQESTGREEQDREG